MSRAALGDAELSRASEWRPDSVRVNAIGPVAPVFRDRHHPSPVWVSRSGGSRIHSTTLRELGETSQQTISTKTITCGTVAGRLITRRTLNVDWEDERSAFAGPRSPLP